MYSGADVVNEPRQRQFGGAASAAERIARLEDDDLAAGVRDRDRCG
jgi:hypothetical protein